MRRVLEGGIFSDLSVNDAAFLDREYGSFIDKRYIYKNFHVNNVIFNNAVTKLFTILDFFSKTKLFEVP